MQTIVLSSTSALIDHAEPWNQLWDRSDSTFPLGRAEPVANQVDYFHHDDLFLAIVVADAGRWVAALPLIAGRRWGMRVGMTLNNPWNYCGDFLIDPNANATAVAKHLLAAARREGLDALWAELVPLDRIPWRTLSHLTVATESPCFVEPQYFYGETQFDGAWSAFRQRQLSRNRRKSLQKCARRLADMGDVRFRSLRHDPDFRPFDDAVETAFGIEHSQWKGQSGGSVLSQSGMLSFFQRQSRLLAAAGMLNLQFLELNGRPIAFEMGYLAKDVYYSHKIGFDPSCRAVGPGQLLTEYQLRQLVTIDGCRRVDSMGILNEATKTWTTKVLPRGRIIVSTGTMRGRLGVRSYAWAKSTYRAMRRRSDTGKHAAPSESSDAVTDTLPVPVKTAGEHATAPPGSMAEFSQFGPTSVQERVRAARQ